MKSLIMIAIFVSLCASTASAKPIEMEEPKEFKAPAKVVTSSDLPNFHEVEMVWPRKTPLIKERKVVPENAVVPPDQGYQVACQHGNLERCSGIDLAAAESTIRVPKSLPAIKRPPPLAIKLIADAEEPLPRRARRWKRR